MGFLIITFETSVIFFLDNFFSINTIIAHHLSTKDKHLQCLITAILAEQEYAFPTVRNTVPASAPSTTM